MELPFEIDVPAGCTAEVVTWVEMHSAPATRPASNVPWTLELRQTPDLEWYRDLYRAVGEEWMWHSRLLLDDGALSAILNDPKVETYTLKREDVDVGILELNFGEPGSVEVSFFGVVASEFGTGAGRWLMAKALERAWAEQPERVWLHTCSLDHPNALPFYMKQGFKAFKRTVYICQDSRLTGVLRPDAAAQTPIIP